MQLALYQPDIAQNVGAIMRLCACFNVTLHIIEPCGFAFDMQKIKRSGMDYIDHVVLRRHVNIETFLEERPFERLLLLTTKGSTPIDQHQFDTGDCLLMGRESAGVPDDVAKDCDARIRIPMHAGMRSLNVAQSAAIALYEGLKQTGGL